MTLKYPDDTNYNSICAKRGPVLWRGSSLSLCLAFIWLKWLIRGGSSIHHAGLEVTTYSIRLKLNS